MHRHVSKPSTPPRVEMPPQHSDDALERVRRAFYAGIWATLASIAIGFVYKVALARWVPKADLALFHSAVDVIALSLILMTGFRFSMVVSYSQTHKDRDITNIFRGALVIMVLLTWGVVLPWLKHRLNVQVDYVYLVGIILSMSLKIYFTNQLAMYRLYDITNRTTWLDPATQMGAFTLCYFALSMPPIGALFISQALSALMVAGFMFLARRRRIATLPLAQVRFDADMRAFVKKSFTAALEAGSSILMIYLAVLMTLRYFSVEELGDFQVVVRPVFTYMTLLFVFPIYRFVLPELSVCLRQGAHHSVVKIKRWLQRLSLTVSCLFAAVMLSCGDLLLHWLFPADYAGALSVLIHFSLFFIFMMLNAYQLAYIKANGLFTTSLLIRLMGIGVMIGSFYIWREATGNVVSIILALSTAYLMMFAVSSVVERRIVRKHRMVEEH